MIYILGIIGIVFGERKLKQYIEDNKCLGKEERIANGKIIITKYHNKGAALNFMEKHPNILITIICMMIGLVILAFAKLLGKKGEVVTKLGFTLILGGAFSNLLDRLEHGYVIDYFRFNWGKKFRKIVFNLADMCIILGSIVVFLASLFRKE